MVPGRTSKRSSTWVYALGLLVLASGCLAVEPDSDPEPGADRPPSPTEWTVGEKWSNATWTTQWDGDLAVAVQLNASEAVECQVIWAAWGVSDHLRPTFGIIVQHSDGLFVDLGRGQSNFDPSVHMHAGGTIDHEVFPGTYGWTDFVNRTFPLTPESPLEITGFAIGLRSQDPDGLRPTSWVLPNAWEDDSALLRISCNRDVDVAALGLGTTVDVFDESGFRGGAGAHAHAVFDPSGATIASRVEREVAHENALVAIDLYGDLLLNHLAVGVVEIDHPDGSETLIDYPSELLVGCITGLACPITTYLHESGAGTYGVTATYASVEITGILRGVILGHDPTDSLPMGDSAN
ncbi:MAG: hypothetical protein KY455_04885 [Euryarchaeota archaeon]|nr:hypothetical protein [Euryarchaeota archaeon]